MKLNQPATIEQTFRRELPASMAQLSGGETPFIEIVAKPGGYLNTALTARMESDEIADRISRAQIHGNVADRAAAELHIERESAKRRIASIFDTCVVSWKTNITDDGKVMEFSRDNFIALPLAGVVEIITIFTEFAQFINDVANFIAEDDGETEKN